MSDNIRFHSSYQPWKGPRNKKQIKPWLSSIIKESGFSLRSLQIIFVSDDDLLKINREFLDHDYYTDVIGFDFSDEENILDGEIYISVDRVKENAKTNSVGIDEELRRVIAHGTLHFLGYSDKTDSEKRIMKEMENKCLSSFANVPRGTNQ